MTRRQNTTLATSFLALTLCQAGAPVAQQAGTGGVPASSDIGPAPGGSFTVLTALEIRNDTAVPRVNELAFSGVPLARSLNLTSLSNLVVVSREGRQVAGQFSVLSRWGGSRDDASRAVRWAQIAVMANVPAQSTTTYELRHYAAPPSAPHPSDVRLSQQSGIYTVETGEASFDLDPASPGLLRAVRRRGVTVFRDSPGAGPHVVDGSGMTLGPRPDVNGFAIEESGPVRVVARQRGHFGRGSTGCASDLGYVVRMTFERASSDLAVQFHIVNECGDGYEPGGELASGAPWWNKTYPVHDVSWHFPFALEGAPASYVKGGGTVHRSAGHALRVAQERSRAGASPVRSARVTGGVTTIEAAESFDDPFVAVSDTRTAALLQMPWMRYREPQALSVENGALSFHLVSGPAVIGEAQGIWGFARLSLFDGAPTDAMLQQVSNRGRVALERGLLVHVPVGYFDGTRVMPPLSPAGRAEAQQLYLDALQKVHADTVARGGQWDRMKAYGSAIWPDYTMSEDVVEVSDPRESAPSSNYWSATSAELKQWFVDGDPKWVWDFALPQEHTQIFTNYYNLGSRNATVGVNYRGGFTVLAGSRGAEGEAFRAGWGSDDYTYNQGTDEAYLVRPNGAMVERFQDAADTFIRRYGPVNIPVADQQRRDEDLQSLRIARGQAQHVNFLSYAAQFAVEGADRYVRTLTSVMDEYAADNLRGGIFCQADFGNEQSCTGTWGIYHFVSLQVVPFLDYLYWAGPGDQRAAIIARALTTTADMYYQVLMRAPGAGTFDASAPWYGSLHCTFRDNGAALDGCRGVDAEEPVYAHERPAALSFVLLASAMTADQAQCDRVAAALPSVMDEGLHYLHSGSGWNKGAAQSMSLIAHGLAQSACRRQAPAVPSGLRMIAQ